MVGFWSRAIGDNIRLEPDFKNFCRILVEGDSIVGFQKFLFVELYGSSRTTMSPSTFLYLVKKLSKLWSDFGRAEQQCPQALSDFKNFWFVELYGSSRTTMSPSTFLYLVKKLSKLWSDFGRGR